MSAWRHEGSSQDEKTGILIHMDIKVCVCLLVYCTIYMQGVIISACVCVFSNMSLGDPAVFNYGSSINVFIFSPRWWQALKIATEEWSAFLLMVFFAYVGYAHQCECQ